MRAERAGTDQETRKGAMAPGGFPATHGPAADARSGSEDLPGLQCCPGSPGRESSRACLSLSSSQGSPGFIQVRL